MKQPSIRYNLEVCVYYVTCQCGVVYMSYTSFLAWYNLSPKLSLHWDHYEQHQGCYWVSL